MQSGGPNRERYISGCRGDIASILFFLKQGSLLSHPCPLSSGHRPAHYIAPAKCRPAFILFSSVSIRFNLFEYVPIMSDDVINSKHGEILDTAQDPTYHKHPVEFTAC